jgi:transcriptional regulator with XRE-family HTH domain
MNTQIIAKNLVRLRQSQDWTQDDMSDKLHISRQAISKWETGASIPNLDALLELSKLFKLTINEILELTDSYYTTFTLK